MGSLRVVKSSRTTAQVVSNGAATSVAADCSGASAGGWYLGPPQPAQQAMTMNVRQPRTIRLLYKGKNEEDRIYIAKDERATLAVNLDSYQH
jgi:hypothetical protein